LKYEAGVYKGWSIFSLEIIIQLKHLHTTSLNISTIIPFISIHHQHHTQQPTPPKMKFTTAAIVSTAAALVAAAPSSTNPSNSKITDGDVFSIMTLRSGSDIHYGTVQAVNSGLRVNSPSQNASCSEDVNYASFVINNGTLSLYTENPSQQFFVDRSGMGQGIIQYTTGAQQASKNGETRTFAITEDGDLVFRDQTGQDIGFQACPGALGGGYSVWLDSATNPGGHENCLDFSARALKEENPVSCSYTS
jgi:hypothetical protein